MSAPPDPREGFPRLPVVPFLAILHRRRRLLVVLTLVAAVTAAVASLIAPITYESTLTILPPQSDTGMDLIGGGLVSSLARLQMGFAASMSTDLFANMITSRSVMRQAIDRLDLIGYYHLRGLDTLQAYAFAYGTLKEDVTVRTSNNGLITLQTRARTGYFAGRAARLRARQMAADLGNTLALGLNAVHQEKNTSRARQARLYLEEQLTLTDQRLDTAGRALAAFQRRHLAISLDDQMRVGIEMAGKLEGELLAREVALGIALRAMQADNPEIRSLRSEVDEIRRQLRGLQTGGARGEGDSLSLGLEQLPDLAREYGFLLREVKIQEKVYELLTEQLYYARVKETETMPVIQVLDRADVPIFKKSPIVRRVTLLAAALGFILAVFLACGLEWWERYPWRQADSTEFRRLLRR